MVTIYVWFRNVYPHQHSNCWGQFFGFFFPEKLVFKTKQEGDKILSCFIDWLRFCQDSSTCWFSSSQSAPGEMTFSAPQPQADVGTWGALQEQESQLARTAPERGEKEAGRERLEWIEHILKQYFPVIFVNSSMSLLFKAKKKYLKNPSYRAGAP